MSDDGRPRGRLVYFSRLDPPEAFPDMPVYWTRHTDRMVRIQQAKNDQQAQLLDAYLHGVQWDAPSWPWWRRLWRWICRL